MSSSYVHMLHYRAELHDHGQHFLPINPLSLGILMPYDANLHPFDTNTPSYPSQRRCDITLGPKRKRPRVELSSSLARLHGLIYLINAPPHGSRTLSKQDGTA